MPFPPIFADVWDISQPLDTQLANLLGQDIRNLKNDVMQRMSLLSGLLTNRPTPETVNATWGGIGFGILYFATDTSQVFQWDGSNWNDVSSNIGGGSVTLVDANQYSIVNPGAPTTANSVTLGVGVTGTFIFEAAAKKNSGANTCGVSLNIGNQTIATVTLSSNGDVAVFKGAVSWVISATTLLTYSVTAFLNGVATQFVLQTTAANVSPFKAFLRFASSVSFNGTGILLAGTRG